MRADALRNHGALTAEAHTLFAAKGASVELDELASAASVGVASVYRHLGPKDAILALVIGNVLDDLTEEARVLALDLEPTDAFYALLETLVATPTKRNLVALFDDSWAPTTPKWSAARTALRERLRYLVAGALVLAQDAGTVRTDVSVAEVLALIEGAFPHFARENGDEIAARRLFPLFRRALAPEASTVPPSRGRLTPAASPPLPLPARDRRQVQFAFTGSSNDPTAKTVPGPLTREHAHGGIAWIPRVLWALEWARLGNLGPQTPAEMARILGEHAGLAVPPTNVARAFRDLVGNREFRSTWKRLGSAYEIRPSGTALLRAILSGAPPLDTSNAEERKSRVAAETKRDGSRRRTVPS